METLADAYISHLKERLGTRSDDQLASKIGVGKSTIASWRRRGDIPDQAVRDIEEKCGLSLSAVCREFLAEALNRSRIGDMILLVIAMRLSQSLAKNKVEDWAQWIGASREDVLTEIVARTGGWNRAKESLVDKLHAIYCAVISDSSYGKLFMDELRPKIEAQLPDRHKGFGYQ